MESDDCNIAINTLKDSRPWIDRGVKHPKELQKELLDDLKNAIKEQFDNVKVKSNKAAELIEKILVIERVDPDPKKLA